MQKTIKTDGVHQSKDIVEYRGPSVIHTVGELGGCTIEIGFMVGSKFHKIPSSEVYTSEISLTITFGVGVRPAIRLASTSGTTDLDFLHKPA